MSLVDPCEVCQIRNAVGIFNRTWHDSTVDEDLHLCHECAEDDIDGMYKFEFIES